VRAPTPARPVASQPPTLPRRYYKFNDVQKFSFTRRLDQRSAELCARLNVQSDFLMCMQQTVLVTRKPFPNMLRFSPVVSSESVTASAVLVSRRSHCLAGRTRPGPGGLPEYEAVAGLADTVHRRLRQADQRGHGEAGLAQDPGYRQPGRDGRHRQLREGAYAGPQAPTSELTSIQDHLHRQLPGRLRPEGARLCRPDQGTDRRAGRRRCPSPRTWAPRQPVRRCPCWRRACTCCC